MTLSAVAKRAGMSNGASWRYFQTKAELAYAAVRDALDQHREGLTGHSSAADREAIVAFLVDQPTDALSRAVRELLRAAAVDEGVRSQLAGGGWTQWLDWSEAFLRLTGQERLDERTAALIRVLSLASTSLYLFFKDEDMAAVLRSDIERLVKELVEHQSLGIPEASR